jgi:hypothetical protein
MTETAAPAAPDEAERPEQWMVYLREWLIFYTSQQRGDDGWSECLDWFTRHYQGKIRVSDWRIVTPGGLSGIPARDAHQGKWRLQLYAPNLKGVFRHAEDAAARATELGLDAVVAARFSAEERKLLRYGKSLIRGQ